LAISNELIEPKQQEPIMKLSHITAAIFLSASAISSAQAQTISVNPQTLIMNFAAGEHLLERIAQLAPGQVAAITATGPAAVASAAAPAAPAAAPTAPVVVPVAPTAPPVAPAVAPVAPAAAPSYPLSANPVSAPAPVEVPSFIGGQKIGADAQRVTKCLIENHGDKYICGMQELNGEIAKCVGGVGTVGGCFTAPLTRQRESTPRPHPHYYRRYYTSYHNNYINIF
jgi:hypothetical protein